VAGLRADQHSLYGLFVTPRIHVRYEPWTGGTFRVSFGRGQRTANIFAENMGLMASSRTIAVVGKGNAGAYGLDPEVAWNKGISYDQKFKLGSKNLVLALDYFRNDFTNQVVVDLEDPRKALFYNLSGKSFSNSFQAELSSTLFTRFEVRLAYRYFDVRTTYGGQLLQRPYTAQHRGFMNLAYAIKGWTFDWTLNWNGPKRIPSTASNPVEYRHEERSPSYMLMNAQVSKKFGKAGLFEWYLGGENLTGFRQEKLIIAGDDPFGPWFDASMVWGPVNGRMLYTGFRLRIK
jgi:outer membrane receptor for ferrienterochelin and colicin